MPNIIVNSIVSAAYQKDGSIVFVFDADLDEVNFANLNHNYKENEKDELNTLCKEWLVSNVPSDFVEYVPTDLEVETTARNIRNDLLNSTMWIVQRHQSEVANASLTTTTLTEEEYQNWLVYHQTLRDISLQSGWPHNVIWPDKPE